MKQEVTLTSGGSLQATKAHRAHAADFACNVHLHTDKGIRRTEEKPQILWCRLSALNTIKEAIGLTITYKS